MDFSAQGLLRFGAVNARESGDLPLAAMAEVTADNLGSEPMEPNVLTVLEGALENYQQTRRGRL